MNDRFLDSSVAASPSTSEAMEAYRRSHLAQRDDLGQFQPISLGSVLRPLSRGDGLLAEMLDER